MRHYLWTVRTFNLCKFSIFLEKRLTGSILTLYSTNSQTPLVVSLSFSLSLFLSLSSLHSLSQPICIKFREKQFLHFFYLLRHAMRTSRYINDPSSQLEARHLYFVSVEATLRQELNIEVPLCARHGNKLRQRCT